MLEEVFLSLYILSCTLYFKDFPATPPSIFKLLPLILLLLKTLCQWYTEPSLSDLPVLLVAQLFSLLGDFLLLFPSTYFIHGIGAFLITQILYTYLFGVNTCYVSTFVFIACMSTILFYGILVPNLPDNRFLQMAVIVYCIFISIMLWSATTLLDIHELSYGSLFAFFGAVLFYISDFSLAVNKWVLELTFLQLVNMSTYFLSQLLISYAIVRLQ